MKWVDNNEWSKLRSYSQVLTIHTWQAPVSNKIAWESNGVQHRPNLIHLTRKVLLLVASRIYYLWMVILYFQTIAAPFPHIQHQSQRCKQEEKHQWRSSRPWWQLLFTQKPFNHLHPTGTLNLLNVIFFLGFIPQNWSMAHATLSETR